MIAGLLFNCQKIYGVIMTEREKMLSGQLYDCAYTELLSQWHKATDLTRDYNNTDSANIQEKERNLNQILGGKGENFWITAPSLLTMATIFFLVTIVK